jgi:fatty acid desaturase
MDPLRRGQGVPFYEPPPRSKERGTLFSGFLIFNAIANMGLAAGGVYNAIELSKAELIMATADQAFAPKLAWAAAIVAFANLVALIGMWAWKQWGLYLFLSLSSLGALIAVRLDYVPNILVNLLSVLLVLILAVPKWKHFE